MSETSEGGGVGPNRGRQGQWTYFGRDLKDRGLRDVEFEVSKRGLSMAENLDKFYAEARRRQSMASALTKNEPLALTKNYPG
jgi:hypothetical protein